MTSTQVHHGGQFPQKGFTLFEVLIAVLILAFGILGMATLQLNSLKLNQTSSARTQASYLAADIADRLRANRDEALAGDYDLALGANAPGGAGISATDLQRWKTSLATSLPEGDGSIFRNGSRFVITVQWNESRVSEGSATQTFVFETGL